VTQSGFKLAMPIENKIKHMKKQTPGEVSVQHEQGVSSPPVAYWRSL
jgi:hypothetical protein